MSKLRTYPGWQILILLLVLGGIIGGWIGDATQAVWPVANLWAKSRMVGIPDFSLDLGVLKFSFGFMIDLNLFSILGFIVAYMVYKKL